MRVKDKYSDSIDTSSFTFPSKTPEELRSFEVALEEHKFRDQFMLCSRFRSATSPEKETTQAMGVASQAFLQDARDKALNSGGRSFLFRGREPTEDLWNELFLQLNPMSFGRWLLPKGVCSRRVLDDANIMTS
ncbi:hypothetical protein Smp_148170 [Schistosoma mansoni]|uniref:hypothetical protein n=1 Tax=Schistosoma mansoni TaxID=6183 RepID=UPI0001A6307D|nr:hypothetical protein Smp_148170 [Schistosoma mansoni]|eukprot:XP_018654403.1 hypothetical protein Smp_148170 [Schistosoma mansoni]